MAVGKESDICSCVSLTGGSAGLFGTYQAEAEDCGVGGVGPGADRSGKPAASNEQVSQKHRLRYHTVWQQKFC